MDELSICADVIESNGKGAIVVDRKYVGKVARIIDADDRNRPGENTIFGSPSPEFPDITRQVIEVNDEIL
jgi:hypothetical protein